MAVIERAFRETGEPPTAGRTIRLASGRDLRVDVGSGHHRFGVSYLSSSDKAGLDLPLDLPTRPPPNDFWITQGSGPESQSVILLLDGDDYRLDRRAASHGEHTSNLVEEKLDKDVREFLSVARRKGLP